MAKPKPSTPSRPSPPATLDAFLASSSSSRKRTAQPADPGAGSKKPKTASATPTKASGKGKGKAKTSTAAAKKGKVKAKAKGKGKAPLKPDNRNLGTLDLLDSTDDEIEVVEPEEEGENGVGGGAEMKGKGKGKERMQLEEEEWMVDEGEGRGEEPEGREGDWPPSKEGEEGEDASFSLDVVNPPPAVSSAPKVPADPADPVAPAEEAKGKDGGGREEGEKMDLDAEQEEDGEGSDDEVEIIAGGGVEKCEQCGEVLEGLTAKKRDSHLSTCASSASAASPAASTSTSTASKPSFLAPLSRLFSSRVPSSSSPSGPSTISSSAAGASAPGKKPLGGVLSALPNAFTALMQGHSETAQWKLAEESEKKKGRLPKGEVRGVPFYKWIDGMEITVDAFKYGKIEGCKGYFLSHAHADHYQNLSSSWSGGPIYASQTTINLIKLKLGVKDEYLFPLPLDKTVKVCGIDVTLIDANHCPGSVLFLFEGPHTDPKSPYSKTPDKIFRYLHCGDFRASPQHVLHPALSFPAKPPTSRKPSSTSMTRSSSTGDPLLGRTLKPLAAIYLDTTYLSPSYCFPAQDLVVQACADLVRERVESGEESVLWRADGREAERKGMRGWLGGGGGVKDEVKDEDGGLVEMPLLPEEEEDDGAYSGSRAPSLAPSLAGSARPAAEEEEEPDEEGEEEEDEEAWRDAHAESQPFSASLPGAEDADEESQRAAAAAPEGAEEEKPEPLDEVECEPCAEGVREEFDAAGDGDGDGECACEKVKEEDGEEAAVKVEEREGDADVVKKEDGDSDVKPDVKPDIKPDIKPDLKPTTERLLVLIGTYSIGKERIFKAIASALSTKVYCDGRKKAHLLAQDDPELHALLTDDPLEAQVHLGGLRDIAREQLQEYLGKYNAKRVQGGFTKVIGLRPTGWTYRSESKDKFPSIPKILQLEQQRKFSPAGLYPQRDSTPLTMAFGVPYSEHSSFFELTCFCLSLDYTRIIPTVNVHTATSRNKMKAWIDRWAAEKKRRKEQRLPKVVPYRSERYW
ncbi:hypothetical protein JCM6882_003687 [Rhodosporidiobolus microsporus]